MARIDRERHLNAFQQRGLSLPEWFVFSIPGQWPVPATDLPHTAASQSEGDPRGSVSALECRHALQSLLQRGLLRIVNGHTADELARELRVRGCPAPVYGYPAPGDVDFTERGATVFKDLSKALYGPAFFSEATVESEDEAEVRFFAIDEHKAAQIAAEAGAKDPGAEVALEPIGPWCIYWWNCFDSGFLVKVYRTKTTAVPAE